MCMYSHKISIILEIIFHLNQTERQHLMSMRMITYLLYRTMSGSHIDSEGTYSIFTPPYSWGFQRKPQSSHSYK